MHLVQTDISRNLHMRTSVIQRTSCLYFYDICIITCQSDCKKGNRDWFVSLKFRIELDRNDLLWTCFDYCEEGN